MSLSLEDAYAKIKQLENNGTIHLPTPQEIVEVGSIDATTGEFTFSVPIQDQVFFQPTIGPIQSPPHPHIAGGSGGTGVGIGIGNPIGNPGPGGPPIPPAHIALGIVQTSAVDLILKFNVTNIPLKQPVNKLNHSDLATRFGKGFNPPFFPPQSGVTLTFPGWKVLSSAGDEILLDAGFAASSSLNTHFVQPAIESFPIQLNTALGEQFIHIAILRPPVLGFGAFTIPALPLAVIYAPPQGKLNSNTTVWTDMVSNTHILTTSVNTASNTKAVPAFSTADLIGKVTGAITTVAGLVSAAGAGGAAAGAGASASADAGLSLGQSLTLIKSEFDAVTTLVGAFDNTDMTTNTTGSTIESDQSVTVNITTTLTFTTRAGKGPGVGDIFVCLQNLRVVWVAVNGDVGISILGYEALAAPTAETLFADQKALATGQPTVSGFDAATIHMLLGLDPFCAPHSIFAVHQGPPLVSAPRFVPASPAAYNGSDQTFNFSASVDQSTDNKSIQTSITTSVEDVKPGWGSVLFGTPNVETTTTMTFTNSQSTEDITEEKISNSATFISDNSADGYHIKAFYDRTFGTVLFADQNSFVLQGTSGVILHK